ncbi:MAG: tape measure protein [Blastomonas fulva]|uniref:tape measure protein n=1 Tax=Blastomonas fulva TaxID=1550728 RepID=UPI0040346ED1
MALKLSLLLQAVDRISAPVKRIQESTRRMGEGIQRAAQKIDRAGAPMERLSNKVQRLRTKLLGTLVAVNRASGPNGLDLLGKASDRAGFAVGRLLGKMGGLAGTMASWGATAAAGATGFAIFDMFKTAGQFEQIEIALEGLTGSSASAKQAMAWIQEFAARTPYQLQEVALGFKNIKGLGLDPLDGSLRSVGDAAAGTAVALEKGVEALGDAMRGEFERLKEFNIVARQSGDQVTFSYIKNGKRIERSAKKTELALKDAVLASFDEMYGGGMERQSRSLFGLLNSLGDKWTEFQLKVANVGVFDKVKGRVEGLLARIEKMAASGELDALAERIGKNLEKAFDWAWQFAEEIKWDKLGSDLATAAQAAGTLASAMIKIVGALGKIKRGGANLTYGMDWMFLGSREADRNWERMYPDEKRQKSSRELRRDARDAARDAVGLNGPKEGLKLPGARLPRAKVPGAASDSGKVKVGGVIQLKVSATQGTKVAVASMKPDSRDVPWSIQIARSNWVPA